MAKTPQEETEAVLNVLMPLAKEALTRYGAFVPFAAVMRTDGSLAPMRAESGGAQAQQQVLEALAEALRTGAAQKAYRATGLALLIRTTVPGSEEKTDAVAVQLEHADSDSVVVVYPYRRLPQGEVSFGPPFARQVEGGVF